MWLPSEYLPLVSVTSLNVNSGTDFDNTWNAKTEGTDYLIEDLDTGRLQFISSVTLLSLSRGIKTTFESGYSSVPEFVSKLSRNMVVLDYIRSELSNTSVNTKEKIRVGPIAIENSSGEVLKFVQDLKETIANDLDNLNKLKTTAY